VRGHDAESLLGESGWLGKLKKQLAERMLSAELNHHLATERTSGDEAGNHRNGSQRKTVLTPNGPLPLDNPARPASPALIRLLVLNPDGACPSR